MIHFTIRYRCDKMPENTWVRAGIEADNVEVLESVMSACMGVCEYEIVSQEEV